MKSLTITVLMILGTANAAANCKVVTIFDNDGEDRQIIVCTD